MRLIANPGEEGGWQISEANWWMPGKVHPIPTASSPKAKFGWVMHTIELQSDEGESALFRFSRRYDRGTLESLLEGMEIRLAEGSQLQPVGAEMIAEFA